MWRSPATISRNRRRRLLESQPTRSRPGPPPQIVGWSGRYPKPKNRVDPKLECQPKPPVEHARCLRLRLQGVCWCARRPLNPRIHRCCPPLPSHPEHYPLRWVRRSVSLLKAVRRHKAHRGWISLRPQVGSSLLQPATRVNRRRGSIWEAMRHHRSEPWSRLFPAHSQREARIHWIRHRTDRTRLILAARLTICPRRPHPDPTGPGPIAMPSEPLLPVPIYAT